MEFTFDTQYNAKTMAVMAKALRKTIRKKHSRRSHIMGWIVIVLAVLLMAANGFTLEMRTVVTAIAVLAILLALLFEDRINGSIAQKRLLAGTERAVTVFREDSFVSATEVGKTEWNYDKILTIAEAGDFFVFILSANHAQLYDKRSLQGGTTEDFRRFIETAAGKQILQVK